MKIRITLAVAMLPIAIGSATAGQSAYDKVLAEIEQKTGLKTVEVPGTQGAYLGKTHRGQWFEAMLFGHAERLPPAINAVYRFGVNEFNGSVTLQLTLEHWEAMQSDV